MADEAIIFKGSSGSECERFLSAIRKKAFALGMQRNKDWLADFSATCFEGEAIRWYETPSPETQNDWTLLRNALLDRWPADRNQDSAASSAGIPTPAAAAPSPAIGLMRSSKSGISLEGYERGVIKLLSNGVDYYLSRDLVKSDEPGKQHLNVGMRAVEANDARRLHVWAKRSDRVGRVFCEEFMNTYPILGFLSSSPELTTANSARPLVGFLTPIDLSPFGAPSSAIEAPDLPGITAHRRTCTDVWMVDESGDMSLFVADDITGEALRLRVVLFTEPSGSTSDIIVCITAQIQLDKAPKNGEGDDQVKHPQNVKFIPLDP